MNWWSNFCDSLNTRGGTIALLYIATMILGALCIRQMSLHVVGEEASLFRSTFSSFSGALLLALTQKDKTNGNGGSK
jgi:hypothetical protein